MKYIDLSSWERRGAYEIFRHAANPHYGITADIDVSRFVVDIKPKGISVFNAVLFAIMKAVNSVPEFRIRFKGDEIYEYPVTHPSFTIPIQENQFAFCEATYSEDWAEFDRLCNTAKQEAIKQTQLTENTKSDQWTFLTCTPWVHFTGLSHAYDGPDDCIPRIAWGKFTFREDKWWMPLNVQAHHATMDGYHMSKMYELTEKILNEETFE